MWFGGLYTKQLPSHHLSLSNYLRKIAFDNSSYPSTVFKIQHHMHLFFFQSITICNYFIYFLILFKNISKFLNAFCVLRFIPGSKDTVMHVLMGLTL